MSAVCDLKSLSNDSMLISELEKREINAYCERIALIEEKEISKNEGKWKEKNEIDKNMLFKNIDVLIISDCTELTIDEIRKNRYNICLFWVRFYLDFLFQGVFLFN